MDKQKDRVEIIIYKDEWESLTEEQRAYIIRVMASHFGMENMEYEGKNDEG